MIVDNGKYYLYRHIRLDTNEPFYIGIGTKNKKTESYDRAFVKNQRNLIWLSITKNTKFIVEIILETDDYNFLEQKEKEFIKLYGRLDKKSGSLTNLTDGGKGSYKIIRSQETREKISKINKNRVVSKESVAKTIATKILKGNLCYTPEQKLNKSISQQVPICQYDFCGNFIKKWKGINEIADFYKCKKYKVTQCAMKNSKNSIFENTFLTYEKDGITEKLKNNINTYCNKNVKIKKKLTNEEIESIIESYKFIFDDTISADKNCKNLSEKLNISKSTIISLLKRTNNYYFKKLYTISPSKAVNQYNKYLELLEKHYNKEL